MWSLSAVQGMLSENFSVAKAVSAGQGIMTIARHNTLSCATETNDLFHSDHLPALTRRMEALETAKDIFVLSFCIFKEKKNITDIIKFV